MLLAAYACLIIILLILASLRAPAWLAAGVLAGLTATGFLLQMPLAATLPALVITAALAFLAIRPLRQRLISDRLYNWFRKVMPTMSDTETEALDAGTVWWDAELFSGKPNWRRLFSTPRPGLSAAERAFLDGPVEDLCGMLDDWQINNELHDLPPEAWEFLREHRFFSMIIPREYGGLDFSAQANAAVVTKIASRNLTAAVTVMVPNSLGPGELLSHFGTEAQKKHHLPRLASGEDIPCFALTAPLAGSDAASMPDRGIICKGMHNGKEVLGLRVTWDKRYITLAPVATLVGLAFKAYDPDGLLGDREELGITCALIPADTPGVECGPRHLPSGSSFMNGTTRGDDVFIPMDWVIGGKDRVGQGWRMLMHCLSAGRAISLPAQSIAAGKMSSLLSGAYARVRQQFKQPIGNFEGIHEPLARIAGETYRMDAAQKLTLVALDQGEKPAVLSAILKYNLTEGNRKVITDSMDIHGGKGVIRGPRNYLVDAFQATPIAITVEGANILTRSMIIFGQGAIRCHPWLIQEMLSARQDTAENRKQFDQAIWGHAGYLISNLVRTPLLALSGGWLAPGPVRGPTAWAVRRTNRFTAAFTLIADIALLILGGKFKFKEQLSGRLADALSHLYMASAMLKRFEDDDRPAADLPLLQWALDDSFYKIQVALDEVLHNYPSRPAAMLLRLLTFPLGRRLHRPNDRNTSTVAGMLLDHNETRERLIAGVYLSQGDDAVGTLLKAFDAALTAAPAERAIRNAVKKVVTPSNYEALVDKTVASGVITEAQAADVRRAQALAAQVIAVDTFPAESIGSHHEAAPQPIAVGAE